MKHSKEDIYNVGHSIARYSKSLIKEWLKTDIVSHPWNFKNIDEWKNALNKMYRAFELIDKEYDDVYIYSPKEHKEIKEGLKLFSKYIRNMWD